MANSSPLRPLASIFLSAIVVLIQAPLILCWIPRLLVITCRSSHAGGRSAGQQMALSAISNVNEGEGELSNDSSDVPGDPNRNGIFPQGDQLAHYVSRLEAIVAGDAEGGSNRPWEDWTEGDETAGMARERVALGDWMEWDESTCVDDSCWDDEFDQCDIPEEYKLAAPTIDVMAFLGIQRAEPLRVKYTRDWD